MDSVTLGIDVACRAAHRASLANREGRFLWSGRSFRTNPQQLKALWARIPERASVTVVLEPTRNAWELLAAWFRARGAKVVLVRPEQAADLRDYYAKHTKTDRLDSRVLARLPLLHPEGLRELDHLGAAEALRRAVKRRSVLAKRLRGTLNRIDCLLELFGPALGDALGGEYGKAALAFLSRYADPYKVRRLGHRRLSDFLRRHSRGRWGEDKAAQLLAAAQETTELWASGELDFSELAEDISSEARLAQSIEEEIARADNRIASLYEKADPESIFRSGPGLGDVLAPWIRGRMGDPNRFGSLAGVRSYTGLVCAVDQSGTSQGNPGPTKAGDANLREALYLAADKARKVDPQLAASYYRLVVEEGKHHTSALCNLAPKLATRLAAAWRRGEHYIIRDTDGRVVTDPEGRQIVKNRWQVPAHVRQARRRSRKAQRQKSRGTSRPSQRSQSASRADPSRSNTTERVIPA